MGKFKKGDLVTDSLENFIWEVIEIIDREVKVKIVFGFHPCRKFNHILPELFSMGTFTPITLEQHLKYLKGEVNV